MARLHPTYICVWPEKPGRCFEPSLRVWVAIQIGYTPGMPSRFASARHKTTLGEFALTRETSNGDKRGLLTGFATCFLTAQPPWAPPAPSPDVLWCDQVRSKVAFAEYGQARQRLPLFLLVGAAKQKATDEGGTRCISSQLPRYPSPAHSTPPQCQRQFPSSTTSSECSLPATLYSLGCASGGISARPDSALRDTSFAIGFERPPLPHRCSVARFPQRPQPPTPSIGIFKGSGES
ncbi:hypothetical protein CC80DRAFT_280950 [Byssothecium circinans]|uniref:Uncharacterized protein n=1 Tax=Byssothecium circinans TaxID=147558 RepID=A0A6A5T7Z7_9PLEO|nr:hypothetical protein CC80DRAFT_280950 [Byssothecium circinans]